MRDDDRGPAAVDHDTLAHELAKADRRTAEQEQIIAKQREKLERLREALTAALDGWQSLVETTTQHAHWSDDDDGKRIVELRKLIDSHWSGR